MCSDVNHTLILPRLPRVSPPCTNNPAIVALANAKGGVGKTSIAANTAGIAALLGWRVLLVDLDPQGNLATDLGFEDKTDLGKSLSMTLRSGEPAAAIEEIRPRLDVWPGGPLLNRALPGALIPQTEDPLSVALGTVRDRYDLVILDCPPALGPLVDAGLLASHQLIVPIRADHASLAGLRMITERYRQAKTVNKDLEMMGITLFDVSRAATAVLREVVTAIRDAFVGTEQPAILPAIRRSERTAFEMRRRGLLAFEYSEIVPSGDAANKLAGDYDDLARQVLARVAEWQARVV